MKNCLLLIAAIALAAVARAAEPIVLDLWPEGAPNQFECPYDQEYLDRCNLSATPFLTVYEAPEPNGKVVLACPGGGYGYLAKYHEGSDFAPWLNEQGITLAVLVYRMPCEHSDVPLSDVHQAMRMLRGMHPGSKVGIMGFSAGGHLASTGATHFVDQETRPDFQILFYPVISMDPAITHMGTRNNLIGAEPAPELEALYSNEKQVTALTPPAIVFHCVDDDVVPVANALRYVQALADAGVPTEMHVYPEGGHGWGFSPGYAYRPFWAEALSAWLANQ